MLVIKGLQGSGKSTLAKLIRRIVDPCRPEVRAFPTNEKDLCIAAKHNSALFFDNASHISIGMSDALCRLITGAGIGHRKLFTDSEESILELRKPICINGIDFNAGREDLIDRSVTISLPGITAKDRIGEEEIYSEFDRLMPEILGFVYQLCARAVKGRLSSKPHYISRMKDYSHIGAALESSLGIKEGQFSDIFKANQESTICDTVLDDPIGNAVFHAAQKLAPWSGTMSELLSKLPEFAIDSTVKSREWPKAPQSLSCRITRLTKGFNTLGIIIDRRNRSGPAGDRIFSITRVER